MDTKPHRYLKHPATDFERAFTPGQRLTDGNRQYVMQTRVLGELCLPTGRIVAADPGNLDANIDRYFTRMVSPGTYPVEVANLVPVGEEAGDTACMRIRFQDQPVAQWIIGVTGDQQPEDLQPFEIYGYGVDVGMGSFADAAALTKLLAAYEKENKRLYEEFYFDVVRPAYEQSSDAASIVIDAETGANLVLCTSGWGDGFYPSYWGLAADESPVCLVTDFGLLKRTVTATIQAGSVYDCLGEINEIELPIGTVSLTVDFPPKGVPGNKSTLIVKLTGNLANQVNLRIHDGKKFIDASRQSRSGDECTYGFTDSVPADATIEVTYPDRVESLFATE